ncbi:hypothetical protein FSP39_020531 [Pinctada imbricata]|uniref:Uncharacterized protein n=1 Tax=Pinctada imbricata TaxID=66713 RepID=A0AA89CA66_PINIB|nr:hypothetical protein FSP39_020531 [Pinctada imbricata]
MDSGDQTLSLETFHTWKVDALKEFFSKRGLSTTGTKAELAALCFSANSLNLPIKATDTEYLSSLHDQYQSLLFHNDKKQPDPLKISGGWKEEKCGIHLWPPVCITDIVTFLIDHGNSENIKKFLNEYKVWKAYEYLQSNFVKEIFYHPISAASEICNLRAKCTPSQRLRDANHTMWIMVRKVSGDIVSAFCSCIAGLGQTCNHVAAMLFRIDAANKMGLSSCTSIPCQWIIPMETKTLPVRIKDLTVKKSRLGVQKSRPLVSVQKKQYTPQASLMFSRQELLDGLKKTIPNACLFKVEGTSGDTGLPGMMLEEIARAATSAQDFINRQPSVSPDQVDVIQGKTIGQSNNPQWHRLRRGRITASNFYSVFTRMNTYEQKPDSDMNNVIKLIMGDASPNPNIKSLKFGRDSEPVAKSIYAQMYDKDHQAASTEECGLFLDKNYSYLAASPDMLVNCKCCGNGLLEIKCAMVPKCDVCKGFCACNVPDYLKFDNHVFVLKKNHKYFCQIQGQMAITGRKWCDLCVYTCNGTHVQRVHFDDTYFANVTRQLVHFFNKFIAVEYIQRKQSTAGNVVEHVDSGEPGDTYFCTLCNCQILEQENISSFSQRSICCDKCHGWFHFKCVGMTESMLNETLQWFCKGCLVCT